MSFNAWPSCADVIEEKFVEEQAPNNWPKLLEALDKAGQDITVFSIYVDRGDDNLFDPDDLQTLDEIWEAVQKEFLGNTDMELSMGYFEDDEGGSRGNEIDYGEYFYVSNYEVFKPKAEQFKDKVQHKQWVSWG
jgi:hypothetical protein